MPDYGASGGGIGQMIQMISALSDMQYKKREIALAEQTHKTQVEQFGQRLGLDKKDARFKDIAKILEQINQGSVDAHTGATDLAGLLGMSKEDADLFAHVAPSATAAHQMFTTAQESAGVNSMTPEQRQVAQQNAYLAGQAQSSRGAQSTGELISNLAGSGNPQAAFGTEMLANLGKGYAIRAATGQDPFQFAMSQAGLQANMAPAAASIAAGLTPHADAMVAAQTQNAATAAQLDAEAMRISAAAQAKLGPSDYTGILGRLSDITKAFADPKNASDASREQLKQQYNSAARLIGIGTINSDADIPNAIGLIGRMLNGFKGSNVPQPGAPPQSSMPQVQPGLSPGNQFAPLMQGSFP